MPARRDERPSRAFRRSRRYKSAAASVGLRIRELRQVAGWTLESASERMGLDFRHLQQIESGTINLTLATVVRVADAFGVAPGLLLPIPARVDQKRKTNSKYGVQGGRSATAHLPNPPSEPATAMAVQKQVGRAIQNLRRAQGLTQVALAQNIDVSTQYVQRVEAGKQNLTIATLVRFANALGVTLDDMLRRSE